MNYIKPIIALTRANLLRLTRDKIYIFFMIILPVMFLVVFGMMYTNNSNLKVNVAVFNHSSTALSKQFVDTLSSVASKDGGIVIADTKSRADADEKLTRGEIDGIIELPQNFGEISAQSHKPTGETTVIYKEGATSTGQTISGLMQSFSTQLNNNLGIEQPYFTVEVKPSTDTGLSNFDYVLAGLLGYTILTIGLMGIANVVPGDKKTGAVKRLHATPITKWQFIASFLFTFLAVGVVSLFVMVILAITVFDFTMRGSWLTFSIFALASAVMMFGFGLAIAGWAKNENQASAAANVVMFPMMFLGGVFIPRFLMPETLQNFTAFVPLTPIVDGIRMAITENASLLELLPQLAAVGLWAVVIYAIAIKVFHWE